jgi:hypothetical protein
MVKATLSIKNGVEIEKFTKLRAFLKTQGEGYSHDRKKKRNQEL